VRIVATTDLSERGKRALDRGGQLAAEIRADLILLHVVADNRSPEAVERATSFALLALENEVDQLQERYGILAETRVANAEPFAGIQDVSATVGADLVVLGAHGPTPLREMFTGTVLERLVRSGERPALMVNRPTLGPYQRVLFALDLTSVDDALAATATRLGLVANREIGLVHATMPIGKSNLAYVGAPTKTIGRHVASVLTEARRAVESFGRRHAIDPRQAVLIVVDGPPLEVVSEAVGSFGAELLIVATRRPSLFKRLVVGSITESLLRSVGCDVLVVPPGTS
jgi:universal stress protein E